MKDTSTHVTQNHPSIPQKIDIFSSWHAKSAVRSRPSIYDCTALNKEELAAKSWFIPDAFPFLNYPQLSQIGHTQKQELLARYLIFFLEYTTLLEHKIVNKSVEFIAHNFLPVPLPRAMRMNALKLYTDEGYHALISADVSHQVADIYNLQIGPRQFNRISQLEKMAAKFPKNYQAWGWFLIGFISETVITKEFLALGKTTIIAPVYNMLNDHLQDEWRHSHYFSNVFLYLWEKLSTHAQDFCAELLPCIIFECFKLEENWLLSNLMEIGVAREVAIEISEQRKSPAATLTRARNGSTTALRVLNRCSFFSNPTYLDIFRSYGLCDDKTPF